MKKGYKLKECNEYKNLIEKSYKKSDLTFNLDKNYCEDKQCFVKVKPNEFPSRLNFEIYWHKLYKNGEIILNNSSYAVFMINNKVVYISDIYLKDNFKNKGITKKIIKHLLYFIYSEFSNIEYISLKSLAKSILIWYKIGFEFYNSLDDKRIKYLIYKKVGKKVDLKKIKVEDIQNLEINEMLESNIEYSVPMYIKIKK